MNKIKINKHIFANNIRTLMNMRKLSQIDLANETGISQSTISRYIKPDCNPNRLNISLLAAFFYVNESWLITGKGPKWAIYFDPLKDDDKGIIINENWLRTGKGEKFLSLNKLENQNNLEYRKIAESQSNWKIKKSLKTNILSCFDDQKWANGIIKDRLKLK